MLRHGVSLSVALLLTMLLHLLHSMGVWTRLNLYLSLLRVVLLLHWSMLVLLLLARVRHLVRMLSVLGRMLLLDVGRSRRGRNWGSLPRARHHLLKVGERRWPGARGGRTPAVVTMRWHLPSDHVFLGRTRSSSSFNSQ